MHIIGVDEAGRGPLAGPVVAAAVILDDSNLPSGLDDSKKLSLKKRESLYEIIINKALAYSVVEIDSLLIDKINILQATLQAMKQAVLDITSKINANLVLIDGNRIIDKELSIEQKAIINGDALIPQIMAASIIAKVYRDRLMSTYDEKYPEYGFIKHKGYGTKMHYEALKNFGPCPIHRLTFRGVISE